MSSTLVTGIGELLTCDGLTPDLLGVRHGAALIAEGGRIAWVGDACTAPEADRRLDVDGRAVLPGFVDSHAHLVFAALTGLAVGAARVVVTRKAASYFAKSTGHLPKPMQEGQA